MEDPGAMMLGVFMFTIAQTAPRSPSLIEQMWPIILVGLFALLGAEWGKRTERRNSQVAWLREERLAACSDLMAACHALWHQASRLDVSARDQNSDNLDALNAALAATSPAGARVKLLGPDDVARAGWAYWSAAYKVGQLVVDCSGDDDDANTPLSDTDVGRQLKEAEAKFFYAASHALGT